MEPQESETDKTETAHDPIAEAELPRIEPTVLPNRPNPRKKLYNIAAVLVLIAGAAAAYLVLKG
jgi:hypothetical protein